MGYVFRQFRPAVLIKPLRQCGESETETVELQALGCLFACVHVLQFDTNCHVTQLNLLCRQIPCIQPQVRVCLLDDQPVTATPNDARL